MDIPVAQMARAAGVRRKSVRLRAIVPTAVLENDLYAIYRDSLNVWAETVRLLGDAYRGYAADADPGTVRIMAATDAQLERTLIYQTEKLGRWVTRVGRWHGDKTIAGVKSALGIEIAPYIQLSDVREILDDAVRTNVALIRELNGSTRAKVEQLVYSSFVNRWTKADFVRELQKAMGITRARARRIASDQTHKLGIALTAYRNRQMGIDNYIWETVGDDRVRPAHRKRDGHIFRWDAPPFDGPPGFAIGCRCHAEPVVEL